MALAASYDFSKRARVLDIGGGTGSFLKFIHRAHPRAGLALFELPGTAAYARSRFSPEEAAAITTIDGDMLKDALPGGYDVLLMAHLLHCCNVEENLGLLKRAHSSAPPGAQLLAVDFFLNETTSACALMSGEFLLLTVSLAYWPSTRVGHRDRLEVLEQRPGRASDARARKVEHIATIDLFMVKQWKMLVVSRAAIHGPAPRHD
jgi:hypothetical protein